MKKSSEHWLFLCLITLVGFSVSPSLLAIEPCGDFGACKTLIEINSSDGDIGFHFLIDGDDLNAVRLSNPSGARVFQDTAKGPLFDQKLTETFVESAEPLCWSDPEADPDEEVVTLTEFLERWEPGSYLFTGKGDQGEKLEGESGLSHALPAAPKNLAFNSGVISWTPGDDLGHCGSYDELSGLVTAGVLPVHPANVPVYSWEITLEPVEMSDLKFSVRVPVNQLSVTVPPDYLASLPDDTLAKIEIGAIEGGDNATFTELGEICINEVEGCEGGEE